MSSSDFDTWFEDVPDASKQSEKKKDVKAAPPPRLAPALEDAEDTAPDPEDEPYEAKSPIYQADDSDTLKPSKLIESKQTKAPLKTKTPEKEDEDRPTPKKRALKPKDEEEEEKPTPKKRAAKPKEDEDEAPKKRAPKPQEEDEDEPSSKKQVKTDIKPKLPNGKVAEKTTPNKVPAKEKQAPKKQVEEEVPSKTFKPQSAKKTLEEDDEEAAPAKPARKRKDPEEVGAKKPPSKIRKKADDHSDTDAPKKKRRSAREEIEEETELLAPFLTEKDKQAAYDHFNELRVGVERLIAVAESLPSEVQSRQVKVLVSQSKKAVDRGREHFMRLAGTVGINMINDTVIEACE